MSEEERKIYVVSTPIGNLGDITYRAVEILNEVDTILCEDTRVTKKLCDHYGITTQRQSYHAHSSEKEEEVIVQKVISGTTFALVSDAGTPTISDPGVKLIDRLRRDIPCVQVIVIPGPTALITALAATGFMGNDFRFFGFIPHKKGRVSFFEELLNHPTIAICYESPHRLMKTLDYLATSSDIGKRRMCVARELTKAFEEIQIGTAKKLKLFFEENPQKVKGEFVLIFDKKG